MCIRDSLDDVYRTTLALVHTAENGDRDFSFYRDPGADVMLTEDEVDPDLIRRAKIFHYGTLSMTHDGEMCIRDSHWYFTADLPTKILRSQNL